jgi:hypothetical protein
MAAPPMSPLSMEIASSRRGDGNSDATSRRLNFTADPETPVSEPTWSATGTAYAAASAIAQVPPRAVALVRSLSFERKQNEAALAAAACSSTASARPVDFCPDEPSFTRLRDEEAQRPEAQEEEELGLAVYPDGALVYAESALADGGVERRALPTDSLYSALLLSWMHAEDAAEGTIALVASGVVLGLAATYLVQLTVASYLFAIVAAAGGRGGALGPGCNADSAWLRLVATSVYACVVVRCLSVTWALWTWLDMFKRAPAKQVLRLRRYDDRGAPLAGTRQGRARAREGLRLLCSHPLFTPVHSSYPHVHRHAHLVSRVGAHTVRVHVLRGAVRWQGSTVHALSTTLSIALSTTLSTLNSPLCTLHWHPCTRLTMACALWRVHCVPCRWRSG